MTMFSQTYLFKNDLYNRRWMYNPHAEVSYCFVFYKKKLYLLRVNGGNEGKRTCKKKVPLDPLVS